MSTQFRSVRPVVGDYAPYYDKYVSLLPNDDIVTTLANQRSETLALLTTITEAQSMFAYAPGKWNIKEVLGHLIDGERVFSYRALWFARNNMTPLPSMEQDDFVKCGGHAQRPWSSITTEYDHLRTSTLDLFGSFDETSWMRRGVASGLDVSVRGLAWIIAGHEMHHCDILKTRYLQQ